MNIATVKIVDGGYKVNDQFFVPNDQDAPIEKQNEDYKAIMRWVNSGNIVQPADRKSSDQLKVEKTSLIKSEAATRISDAYPEWQQTNYMAAVSEIHNKEIVAMKTIPFIAQYQLTAEELQTLKAADACKKFITAIRVKSNSLERSLDAMTSAELEAFDPARDSHWQ